ncbi:MAG: tetratricopeptide repeat protein [Akkermansiaceae bacterium]
MSCINTSYSRLDELEITGNELDLVLGQFAHHGERFYENEVSRTSALLEVDGGDFVARNDLASAYIKLKEYDKAVVEFDRNEELHPGRYETAANRGVLYKKMGEYERAAGYISDSLEIKEEGHMGLGDYYLRMIEWLDAVERDPGYTKNFLGVEYGSGVDVVAGSPLVNKEYLLTLIKNDYSFADVYLVLGDVYLQEGEYQLAIRCYHRAEYLGHHVKWIFSVRFQEVAEGLESLKSADQLVESAHFRTHDGQVRREIEAAEKWLEMYQAVEATLIGEGRAVDFKSMKVELEERGVSKPKVKEAMIYKGEVVDRNRSVMTSYVVDGGYVVLGILAILIVVPVLFLLRWLRGKRKKGVVF